MDRDLYVLERLYDAARNYFMLRETGEPGNRVEAERVKDEMFMALLEAKECALGEYPYPDKASWHDEDRTKTLRFVHLAPGWNTLIYRFPLQPHLEVVGEN